MKKKTKFGISIDSDVMKCAFHKCGKEFDKVYHTRQIYCSVSCRNRACAYNFYHKNTEKVAGYQKVFATRKKEYNQMILKDEQSFLEAYRKHRGSIPY